MKICDACGKPVAMIGMGGAMLCRQCEPDVRAEMERLRSEGRPVNVMHIAKKIFRDMHGTPGVLQVRDVPVDLRERMDKAAFDQKISLRELVLKALYQYLS